MSLDLSSLNESQLAAVRWDEGPLLVLAGPGSGKTRVLTYRIARLIAESPKLRFRVLGVTFTNKAASEMRSRIDGLLSEGRDRAILTTFHSFAAEILRQHGSHIGLRPDFGILSEQADREAVLTDSIKGLSLQNDDFAPKAVQLLPTINRMLDECVESETALKWLGAQPHAKAIAAIYADYRTRLIKANQLDFGSLLAIAVNLLERKSAIAKQIRRVYSYVCVDEFQDTNSAQYRLLVQLASEISPNLFVVADDDQIIYEWNGASPARIEALRKHFGAKVIQLPENFRCPPEVIALANTLIQHNLDRSADKYPLTAHKTVQGKNRITLKSFDDFDEEVAWLASRIGKLRLEDRAESVILARRKKLLEQAVSTLANKSIPAYIAVRKNEFESIPYRWLHAMLRLANAPQDLEQLRRISRAFFQLEGVNVNIDDVVARASVDSGAFLRTWIGEASAREPLNSGTREMLKTSRAALLDRLDYWAFIKAAHDWFNTLQALENREMKSAFDGFADEQVIWDALKSEISSHYTLTELSLHNYLQELDLRAKEKPAPPNSVRCLTIHASKGMEFRHVFLIGLVQEELPSWAAVKKGEHSPEMQEERRNCFVAITRAEETLTLTYAGCYFGWNKQPSSFLAEMGLEV